MFKNYLTTAINNLLGDKVYAGINVAGLAFGLAANPSRTASICCGEFRQTSQAILKAILLVLL